MNWKRLFVSTLFVATLVLMALSTSTTPVVAQTDYPDVTVTITGTAGSPIVEGVVSIAVENLRSIGIKAQADYVDFHVLLSKLFAGELGAVFFAFNVGIEPDHLYDFFHSGTAYNSLIWHFSNATYDEVVENMMKAKTKAEALQYAWQAQVIFQYNEPLTIAYNNLLLTPFNNATFHGFVKGIGRGAPNYWTYLNVRFLNDSPGGDFIVAQSYRPNPVFNIFNEENDAYTAEILGLIYDSLIASWYANSSTIVDIPWLAKSWEISYFPGDDGDDDMNVTFYLFDNITWHDGVPFNADDVAFTYWAFINMTQAGIYTPYTDYLMNVYNVTVWNSTAVSIYSHAAGYFEFHRILAPILPKHILSDIIYNRLGGSSNLTAALQKLPVVRFNSSDLIGTGPFKWDSFDNNTQTTILVKNTNFFFPAKASALQDIPGVSENGPIAPRGPWVDRVIFKVIQDDNVAVLNLLNNEAHLRDSFIDPQYLDLLEAASNVDVFSVWRMGWGHISFNCELFPFNITAFRRAFAFAYDKQKVSEYVFQGYSQPIDSPVPPAAGEWSYEEDLPFHYYYYDNTSAIHQLESAGFKDYDGDGWREWNVQLPTNQTTGGGGGGGEQPTPGPTIPTEYIIGGVAVAVIVVVVVVFFMTRKK
ncbi:MAG: ABC transporter substrate-binding protein [Candidatus Asgardarchaeia archaeon]